VSGGAASRNKGARFQRLVRSFFEGRGWEAIVRQPGEAGEDIRLFEAPWLSVECKGHDKTNLAGWMRQAKEQAGRRIPVVVFNRVGVGERLNRTMRPSGMGCDSPSGRQWALMDSPARS
jgi:hypothetical protein